MALLITDVWAEMLLELHKSLQRQCLNAECIVQCENALDRHISCNVFCWNAYQLCEAVISIQPNVASCVGSANSTVLCFAIYLRESGRLC